MKKSNFVTLIFGTIGGILFAIGMCMALLPAWNAFTPGIVVGCVGLFFLLVMLVVRRRMQGKPRIKLSGKVVGSVLLGIVGALALGVGMCMTMVWSGLFVQGIVVGIVGILLLICLIPLTKGIKPDSQALPQ